MLKSIFYKESIKCCRLLALLTAIAVAMVVYLFVTNSTAIRLDGAVAQWGSIIERGTSVMPSFLERSFIVIAVAIAALQYSTEMANKRLKLTLHLPYSETQIVVCMQAFGVVATALVYATMCLPMWIGLQIYYPIELVNAMFMRLVPYMLAGFASYFFVAWVIVEPIWRRRIANLFIGVCTLSIFTLKGAAHYSYIYAIPTLVAVLFAAWVAALYSASRFKDGAQQ